MTKNKDSLDLFFFFFLRSCLKKTRALCLIRRFKQSKSTGTFLGPLMNKAISMDISAVVAQTTSENKIVLREDGCLDKRK